MATPKGYHKGNPSYGYRVQARVVRPGNCYWTMMEGWFGYEFEAEACAKKLAKSGAGPYRVINALTYEEGQTFRPTWEQLQNAYLPHQTKKRLGMVI